MSHERWTWDWESEEATVFMSEGSGSSSMRSILIPADISSIEVVEGWVSAVRRQNSSSCNFKHNFDQDDKNRMSKSMFEVRQRF